MSVKIGRRPGPSPTSLRASLERDFDRSEGCWIWNGPVASNGYGRVSWEGRRLYAHRASYETYVGPIPVGLVIDHLCRVPRCVNPTHLEPVTAKENTLRGEAPCIVLSRNGVCAKGHLAIPENTYYVKSGRHMCKPCLLARSRRYREAAK